MKSKVIKTFIEQIYQQYLNLYQGTLIPGKKIDGIGQVYFYPFKTKVKEEIHEISSNIYIMDHVLEIFLLEKWKKEKITHMLRLEILEKEILLKIDQSGITTYENRIESQLPRQKGMIANGKTNYYTYSNYHFSMMEFLKDPRAIDWQEISETEYFTKKEPCKKKVLR